jgi:hypothetical protein
MWRSYWRIAGWNLVIRPCGAGYNAMHRNWNRGPLALPRAIDSPGATIDFLLSALRDADAAKRLFRKALSSTLHPQPRVINTDLAPIYGSAIPDDVRCQIQFMNKLFELPA